MAEHLLEKLEEYSQSDYYPLHMPGHKRNISHFGDPFRLDITEIEGFDNLHHAEGVLLEAQKRAAALYGAEESFYLINGSTCGILAAISACTKRGGRILMGRNCHKAAYHGVFLNGLKVSYLYPETDFVRGINGAVTPETVRDSLQETTQEVSLEAFQETLKTTLEEQHPEAVFLTSPTYDGVVSDIRSIAEIVHQVGSILIVDEAHGAHFAMSPYFPESALSCGADLVINSLHKTMPSLTQTALLHVQGKRVDRERLKMYLGIYQSSSPSYVLMAGMDACVDMMQEQGPQLFDDFTCRLEKMRCRLKSMKFLHLVDGKEEGLHAFDYDRSKVIISTENCSLSGPELSHILREQYHLEMEMEAERYVTAIMTVGDKPEGFERLEKALLEINEHLGTSSEGYGQGKNAGDGETEGSEIISFGKISFAKIGSGKISSGKISSGKGKPEKSAALIRNEAVLTIEEAIQSPKKKVKIEEAAGYVSAEYVYLYPPGIPLIVPVERISQELLGQLSYWKSIGLGLQGLADFTGTHISVVVPVTDL